MGRRFWDPEGTAHGIPTYPRNLAPTGLATKNQLRSMGLRPGGHDPVAQLMWASHCGGSRHGVRVAYLYRLDVAKPVRPMTAAKQAALDKAMRARRTCRDCGLEHPYCLPTSLGRTCPPGTGCAALAAA